MRFLPILVCLIFGAGQGAVLDRIAVTVNNDAITESEVLEEIRVTDFLNGTPLELSPAARRAAAERLVDQYLIRHELEAGAYPKGDSKQVDQVLADFEKAHFRNPAEFARKLKEYGISEEDVKTHLAFQLAALQFTDLRFGASSGGTGAGGEADRAADSAGATAASNVDQQLDTWLKQVRSQTRIEFKKEAFE
jgi:parvulin-like peptidyl-prolyl isomerase